MNEMHELREKLCNELKAYDHQEMSPASLEMIDKLAHAIKNIDKIIEYNNGGYSKRSSAIPELRRMMDSAYDERTRQEIGNTIMRLESM